MFLLLYLIFFLSYSPLIFSLSMYTFQYSLLSVTVGQFLWPLLDNFSQCGFSFIKTLPPFLLCIFKDNVKCWEEHKWSAIFLYMSSTCLSCMLNTFYIFPELISNVLCVDKKCLNRNDSPVKVSWRFYYSIIIRTCVYMWCNWNVWEDFNNSWKCASHSNSAIPSYLSSPSLWVWQRV